MKNANQFCLEFESEDFIPWDKQDPGLFGGDMKLSGGKTGIVSLKERWPDALIPYTISASYSKLSLCNSCYLIFTF